jgi:hypothetical protein
MLQRKQTEGGGSRGVPLNSNLGYSVASSASDYGDEGEGTPVLGEYNGGATIRKLGQTPASSGKQQSMQPPTSSRMAPSSSTGIRAPSRMMQRTTSTPTPSSVLPFSNRPTPPTIALHQPTPSLTSNSSTASSSSSLVSTPSDQAFFPKIKAKLTDASRPRKKTVPGAAHIVTPSRTQAFSRQLPSEGIGGAFISGGIDEDEEGEGEGRENISYNMVEDKSDAAFWDGESESGEKENVKVSIRYVYVVLKL